MLFPTFRFALFFLVVLALGWRLSGRPRAWKLLMLAASYVFYAAWDWRFLGLIVLSTVVNETVAVAIHSSEGKSRRSWLIGGVAFNLGLLGYFKYAGFFLSGLSALLRPFGLQPAWFTASIVLPIAISFFTFQGISYVVDVYRREFEPAALIEVALYLAFFPHLVAGPIVRPGEFIPQLRRRRNPEAVDVSRAARLIGRGMVKKVVIASAMAQVADPVFAAPGQYHALGVVVAVLAYAVQIYADFSGYTDMAIGLALLLGIKFPQNFDRPYSAASLQEFWRRWHITLSRWLRDYVYIPLGGNRDGKAQRNLIVTMALGGLWHGASWSFVAWGLFHGAGLALERTGLRRAAVSDGEVTVARSMAGVRAGAGVAGAGSGGAGSVGSTGGSAGGGSGRTVHRAGTGSRWYQRRTDEIPFDEEWEELRRSLEAEDRPIVTPSWVKRIGVFAFVCVGWVFFRATDLGAAGAVLARIFTGWGGGQMGFTAVTVLVIGAMLAAQFVPSRFGDLAEYRFSQLIPLWQGLAFGALLVVVQVLGPQGVAPFIYFKF